MDYPPNNQNNRKPNLAKEILIGLGIPLICYLIAFGCLNAGVNILIIGFLSIVLFGIAIFLSIKLIRKNHLVSGIMSLVLVLPAIFALLLFGACGILVMPL